MNFKQMMMLFEPGMIARRPTWDRCFTLQKLSDGDIVRLHDSRCPVGSFNPQWRQRGYDAMVTDYEFITTDAVKGSISAKEEALPRE